MTSEGFYVPNAWLPLVFFRWCRMYRIKPKDPHRLEAWRRMVAKKKAVYLRDVKPMIADKKVLKIEHKKEPQ